MHTPFLMKRTPQKAATASSGFGTIALLKMHEREVNQTGSQIMSIRYWITLGLPAYECTSLLVRPNASARSPRPIR